MTVHHTLKLYDNKSCFDKLTSCFLSDQINAFIHCFVGARLITSVYELGIAICKNEAVKKFEDLEMGPLVRHQLVLHYFSIEPDATEALKITTENIVSYLTKYMGKKVEKEVLVDEFLEYIMKKKSVSSKEKLAVHIQSLGYCFDVIFFSLASFP